MPVGDLPKPEVLKKEKVGTVSAWEPIAPGYFKIPLTSYLLAVSVVAIPLIYFQTVGQRTWVYRYIFLIGLSLLIYNRAALTRFYGYIKGAVKP